MDHLYSRRALYPILSKSPTHPASSEAYNPLQQIHHIAVMEVWNDAMRSNVIDNVQEEQMGKRRWTSFPSEHFLDLSAAARTPPGTQGPDDVQKNLT